MKRISSVGDYPVPLFYPISTRYYRSGQITAETQVLQAAVNEIKAFPLGFYEAAIIDRLAINITVVAGAGGVARLGIYADNGSLYPGTLLVDAGELTMETLGVRELTLSTPIFLAPGEHVWLAVLPGVAAATVTAVDYASLPALFGCDSAAARGEFGWWKGQAYGALPITFPWGAHTTKSSFVCARIS